MPKTPIAVANTKKAAPADPKPAVERPYRDLAEDQIPDWVNETPDDYEYDLTMYDEGGGSVSGQDISLTRPEFIALKQYLAVRRGYAGQLENRVDASESPVFDDCLIVNNAEETAQKMAAQNLIDDVRSAFDAFIEFASAEDCHFLHQALEIGGSNSSIVKGFFVALKMVVPGDEKEAA